MGFLVKTELFIKRLVFGESFSNVCDFYTEIKVFELKDIQMELTLFSFYQLFGDRFSKKFSWVQELLKKEACQLTKNHYSFFVNIRQIMGARLLFRFRRSLFFLNHAFRSVLRFAAYSRHRIRLVQLFLRLLHALVCIWDIIVVFILI